MKLKFNMLFVLFFQLKRHQIYKLLERRYTGKNERIITIGKNERKTELQSG